MTEESLEPSSIQSNIEPRSTVARSRPAVLIVVDGLGVAPDSEGNAVTRAYTPVFDGLIQRYPVMTLRASGEFVGLMWGEMGNSEVGHLTIGAGRVYYQTYPRIERSIIDGTFFQNEAFLKATNHVKQTGGTLHLMGIVSGGKVHGVDTHCHALLKLAKDQGIKDVAVHAILDGRDTLYNSGIDFLTSLDQKIKELGVGKIATLSGRYYAMDRDNRWDRIEKAYNAIALGQSAQTAENPFDALKASYAKEVYDEEFVPTVITKNGEPIATVKSNDAVIFFNYRPDRAREITKSFVLPSFDKFERKYIENLAFTTATEYEEGLPVNVAFAPEKILNCLSEVLSNAGLVQLHIAETEKYAHVTFFFNGTREDPFPNEDRAIIPSPKVASYDLAPAMSAKQLTDRVISELKTDNYDIIIMNFANPDMVGHTGSTNATIQGVEAVDEGVGRIVDEVLKKNGVVFITADHGNGEEVANLQTGDIDKEHSTNPVPFYIIGRQFEGQAGIAGDVPNGDLSLMPPVGMLADVAPTILKILGLPIPSEMNGTPLIE
ncbi:MAG: 2,3-bisphosphoglycerate-independent phosphoglycerate mutase [Candidatus Uhrbacteria bacterium]|nr:2,3-bisphosphoglycerate-independent phosphoglycerate mutase [Candidatus Uhrbacteria bacterium]